MEFPFTTNKQYFSRDEAKQIDAFIALNVTPRDTWFSASGESRLVLRVDLPEGCVTPLTVYTKPLLDRSKLYHTPTATLAGAKARIVYEKSDKSWTVTDSDEWLEWISGGYQLNEYKPPEKTEAEKKKEELQVSMMKKATPTGKDGFSQGAKWTRKPGTK